MFTFVTIDEKGKLGNAEQRRVRSHVLRKRQRPGPEDLDERRSHHLPSSARRHMHHFRITGHQEKRKDGKAVSVSEAKDNHGALVSVQKTGPSLNHQPYFIPRMSLNFDNEEFSILTTYLPLCIGMCTLENMGFERDIDNSTYRDWLVTDKAYSHAALAVSCAAKAGLYGRSMSKLVWFHTAKAISHLNCSLSDPVLANQNSTIATIITLGTAAAFCGDFRAASQHISGLWLLFNRRGGIASLCDNPHLFISILRLDLVVSLSSGKLGYVHKDPFFLNEAYMHLANTKVPHLSYEQDLQGFVDQRLARTFHEMQTLARDVNRATAGAYRVLESKFCTDLLITQCSLHLLENQLSTSLDECVRLTLLALHSTLWDTQGARPDFQHASSRIYELCHIVQITSSPQFQELMLWILMMGFISNTLSHEVEWIRNRWQVELAILTQRVEWSDVRRRLQGYIWVDTCHDALGKYYFESLLLVN